jgi:pilus assembly protein CpaC
MTIALRKIFLIKGLLLLLAACFSLQVAADEALDSIVTDEVHMVKGEVVTLTVYALTRLSITDPTVADIVNADDKEITIVGNDIGQTELFVWDEHGKRSIKIFVLVRDLKITKARIDKLVKAADIGKDVFVEINEKEGKVVISGQVLEKDRDQLEKLLQPFQDDILNLIKDREETDLVQVDIQVSELSTTLSKSLGFDWSTGTGSTFSPVYTETLPALDGSIGDFFKIGDFERTNNILATVSALLEEGKGRILSKPRLVVVSGEEASFLVGGEIPIRTTTSTGTSTQENVSFKEYGIGMTITPTIKRENKIDTQLNIEISDVDAANAVGEDVAFVTRTAQTRLYLDNGQTIVLAGLIKKNESENIRKVPFVGDIPVVGLLFRKKSTPAANSETEVVISLTPHILTDRKAELAKERAKENQENEMAKDPSVIEDKSSSKAIPYYSGVPREMIGYVQAVQERISQAIVYPQEAKTQGWEGTVKLGMLILRDGTLAFSLIKESSGYEVFDEAALATAKNSAPYAIFPADTNLQEINVTIPIVYSLKKN